MLQKNGSWVSYTFLQKPHSFKRLSILEENCGADIINVTIKCDLFVDKCLKTCRWVSYTFLQKPSLFNHFWILASISGNFFVLENQRFWGNQYLTLLMASKCDEEKNSFTNQVVKDKIVFPLFLVKSNGFWVWAFQFFFVFSLRKNWL